MDAIMCNYWLVSAGALASNTSKKHTHSQNTCVHTCTWLLTVQRRRLWLRSSHDQDWVSTRETWGPLPSCHRALPVPSFPGLNVQHVGDESPPQHVDKARTDRSTYSPGLLCVGETPEITSWLVHGGFASKCELSVLVHAFGRCSPSYPDGLIKGAPNLPSWIIYTTKQSRSTKQDISQNSPGPVCHHDGDRHPDAAASLPK